MKTLLAKWPWLAVLGAAALLFGNQGFRTLLRGRREYGALESDLRRLRTEEAGLKRELRLIQKDDATLERAARKELGLVKPGEIEYRLPSEQR